MRLWLSKKKKYTKIIKFDIHKGSLWANLSKELFVSLSYAWLAWTMSHFFSLQTMSLIMQARLFLYFNHAHFLMPHPFYNNNHACLQSSWVVCHLLHLFVQFDNTLFSFLNFCKSRTTNLMNTEKELQSFFVNNLHMENQLYIYASLQKLESGN